MTERSCLNCPSFLNTGEATAFYQFDGDGISLSLQGRPGRTHTRSSATRFSRRYGCLWRSRSHLRCSHNP